MTLRAKPLENQHFLLFWQCFLLFPNQGSIFSFTFILSSADAFNLGQYRILSFGKEFSPDDIIMVLYYEHALCPFCQNMALFTHSQMTKFLEQTKLKAFADDKQNNKKKYFCLIEYTN